MNSKSMNEQLSAQEVELLNDFQMEELEQRMEMKSWFNNGAEVEIGVGDPGGVPPPSDDVPENPNTGTVPVGGATVTF